MFQEVITYIIIAVAIVVAILKLYRTLAVKKRNKKVNFKNETSPLEHICSDCIADCNIRDASITVRKENSGLCETTVKKVTDS
jgi:hypothetical protein